MLGAINPAWQFSQSNNVKRRGDMNALLNSVYQYAADNQGTLPPGISEKPANIGNGVGEINLCTSLVPDYLAALPSDPSVNSGADVTDCTANYDTGYTIVRSASDNRITVAAPHAESEEAISITR
jgi:hypothetical protein